MTAALFKSTMGKEVARVAKLRDLTPDEWATRLARGVRSYNVMVEELKRIGTVESVARENLTAWLRDYRAETGIRARGGSTVKLPGEEERLRVRGVGNAEMAKLAVMSPTQRGELLNWAISQKGAPVKVAARKPRGGKRPTRNSHASE